jgi:oxygen-independent coproporphyrinogen-3 oxidase
VDVFAQYDRRWELAVAYYHFEAISAPRQFVCFDERLIHINAFLLRCLDTGIVAMDFRMQSDLALRIAETAPRYTSYPTAPHFHGGVTAETVAGWIATVPEGDAVSLYVHIPFCDRLCWFCACHTKQIRRYEPVARYLGSLHSEIRLVGELLANRPTVRALHFGGGSPTMLTPNDMRGLMEALRSSFRIAKDASISVEIDPNDMDEGRLDALAAIGMTRASLGIQDFDPKVQRAINREQSFETTRAVVEGLRRRGVGSVNLDLLYGLPHQTRDSVVATVEQSLSLEPDRIALFGYAHVPWFKKHQTMIDEAWLPKAAERLEQSLAAADIIKRAGYRAIGLDHFALPGDSLNLAAANGRLHRNFQGYTEDLCETLIGLGPSSISRLQQGYAQNTTATGQYEEAVAKGKLATARGVAFTTDDLARGWVIERLMCDFAFSVVDLVERFGGTGQALLAQASSIALREGNHLLELDGDRFVVPEESRPIVRTIAARFDSYLDVGGARHSVAV